MLEDHTGDVVRKALNGLGIPLADAAAQAGLPLEKLAAFLDGDFDVGSAEALATVAGLDRRALVSLPDYRPRQVFVEGVRRLDLPFGAYRVNAWLLEKDDGSVLIDAGLDADSLRDALEDHAASPELVCITHGHRDHIGGWDELVARGLRTMGWEIPGAEPLAPGESLTQGGISCTTWDLSGHCTPALGYLFHGFSRPVWAVGDALFAGSMGGCKTPESYQLALSRLRAACAGLADETWILPGHGPATTWGEERVRNPFLAGW